MPSSQLSFVLGNATVPAYCTVNAAAAAAKSLQSCPTLCDPTGGSPPGSAIPSILQPRTLEWLPFPSPMHESEVAQSCPTLRNPMDCSPPGSSVHGIFFRQEYWSRLPLSRFRCQINLQENSAMAFTMKNC